MLMPSNEYLASGPKLVWLTSQKLKSGEVSGKMFMHVVELPDNYPRLHYPSEGWLSVFEEGAKLGADVAQWYWTTKPLSVIKRFKWENEKWKKA